MQYKQTGIVLPFKRLSVLNINFLAVNSDDFSFSFALIFYTHHETLNTCPGLITVQTTFLVGSFSGKLIIGGNFAFKKFVWFDRKKQLETLN